MHNLYSVELKIDDIAQFMPYLVMAIPSESGNCEAIELSIERHFDDKFLRSKMAETQLYYEGINAMVGGVPIGQDMPAGKRPVSFLQETVATIKDEAFKSDIKMLAGMVEERYLNQLIQFGIGIEEAASRIRQTIEVPFSFLDMYPGNTQIHYKVFTKRELYVI